MRRGRLGVLRLLAALVAAASFSAQQRPRRSRAAVLPRLLPAGDPRRDGGSLGRGRAARQERAPRLRWQRSLRRPEGPRQHRIERIPRVLRRRHAEPGVAVARRPRERCEAAARIIKAFAPPPGAYVFHPYPVTPYHADYLQHADLVERAKKSVRDRPPQALAGLRVRARGAVAERLVTSPAKDGGWDAVVEEVELDALLAASRITLDGWLGPPWLKEGWFHAWLLEAAAMASVPAKRAADELYRRLVTGAAAGPAEAMDLERKLVAALMGGCERVVAGYTVRRERFSSEFSEGVENAAADSQARVQLRHLRADRQAQGLPVERLAPPRHRQQAGRRVEPHRRPARPRGTADLGRARRSGDAPRAGKRDLGGEPRDGDVGRHGRRRLRAGGRAHPRAGHGVPREVGKGKTARARITYRVRPRRFTTIPG